MFAMLLALLAPTYNQPFDEICYGGMAFTENRALAVSLMCMEQDHGVKDYTVFVATRISDQERHTSL